MKRVCTLYVFVDRNFKRKLIRLISTRRTDSPSVGNVLQVGIEPASLGLHHRISPRSARQKVDSSNRCHAMIHRQNADAMVLASARLRGIPPLDVCHFEYYQGGECLSNAHWLRPWHRILHRSPSPLLFA
jgi:hypothetical protein